MTAEWRKSSFCDNAGCVLVKTALGGAWIRDSGDVMDPMWFNVEELTAFARGWLAGEFDLEGTE